MVTKVSLPRTESMNLPRSFMIATDFPITDCAAVAPRQTRISGSTTSISTSSHGLHATMANRRLLMQAPLATPDPLKVLHRIGHVNFIAGNSRVFQRPVKHAAGWPYEGFTFLIFYVARLLTHQHHTCMAGPIAKNGLSSIEVEITSFTRFCRLPERFKRTDSGQEIAGRNVSSFFDHHMQSLSLAWFESR